MKTGDFDYFVLSIFDVGDGKAKKQVKESLDALSEGYEATVTETEPFFQE